MLKRLELVGFKSFADKTQLEFAPGITAIVGPNGSGKSNIVDAVRWILGEQSAKSLRGGEMADVIFNGSSARRSLGLAEVTMTFDNTRRVLASEADEVQITRRVYRDGQGEYLINQQPSRLRDVKDLFLGSGAGHGAYSIIEQGRVDALLQASHKDRRTIFEEAAGISRFKARKLETLRKLEHVEQNLARSNDLLAELDKQLRAVKLQAAKAQRYQEYSGRLQELRVGLGLQEYHDLTVQLQGEAGALGRLRAELEQVTAQAEGDAAAVRRLDAALADVEARLHDAEGRLAQARQQIAAAEAKRDYEAVAAGELETELARARKRRAELAERIARLAGEADAARTECQAGETLAEERRAVLHELEDRLHGVEAELARLRQQVEADRAEHLERLRQSTRFQNDAVGLKSRLDSLRGRRDGLSVRTARAAEHLLSIDLELEDLELAEARFQQELASARDEQGRLAEEQDDLRRQADETRQRLADLRVQRSGLASRIDLLEQLERSQEGLGTGVREVLELVRAARERGPDLFAGATDDWGFVVGLVADCLAVPRDVAPLIDLALGETSQCFLVRDPARLAAALQAREEPFTGRVGFLPLSDRGAGFQPAGGLEAFPTPAADGLRADELVTCDLPDLQHLPRLLLGTTRIVPDLATARAVAATPAGAGLRFVTRQGELLEADGRLTVGTHHAETGLLSRKSELRELRQRATDLDAGIAATDLEHTSLRDRAEAMEQPLYRLQQRINELVEEAGEMSARVKLHRQKRTGLEDEVALSRGEIEGLDAEIAELTEAWAEARRRADEGEHVALQVQARAEAADRAIREREAERLQREQEVSQARVELAQAEERQAGRRERAAQLDTDLAQRRREAAQVEQHETATAARQRDGQLARLEASAALAEWFVYKEAAEAQIADLTAARESARDERRRTAEQLQAAGSERQDKWDRAHAHELRANELRLRIAGLCQRLQEDYQLDLAELYDRRHSAEEPAEPPADDLDAALGAAPATPPEEPPPARLDPVATQQEVEELRRKLARLGAVNLEALTELAELEARVTEKQAQHDDLAKSRHDLLEIINKINTDSKKLFAETFATIRGHFQDLFRKLFGGGMADVFLEDETVVLESGIEITARPPGKELRSISLMSGGERTLTAVALLLAIFRSKPSPFCLLDEVDAALDEANNARLAGVLREFLDSSQFIVITHKKRTMAVADVLYGITMQEAGVSKQVSVRFEDWPDEDQSSEGAAA